MNQAITNWLEIAQANLAPRAKEIVQEQILEHWNSALEKYVLEGKSVLEAEALALADLGDARAAAKKFEKAYLTTRELEKLTAVKDSAANVGFALEIILGGFLLFLQLFKMNHDFIFAMFPVLVIKVLSNLLDRSIARRTVLQDYILFQIKASLAVFFVVMLVFILQQFQGFMVDYWDIVLVFGTLIFIGTTGKNIWAWRKLSSL